MPERIQKLLARAGVASRRGAETLITEGRVRVNGRIVTELGSKASERDKIEVNGKLIFQQAPQYWVLNKPRLVVSTLSDPEGRDCITDLVKKEIRSRVYPVGRLDYHTSGVLLLTNDGDMTNALLHPSGKVEKRYVAKVKGRPNEQAMIKLAEGVELDDGYKTRPAIVQVIRGNSTVTWLTVILKEGKNRQVIRMFEAVGHPVQRLSRLTFAGLDCERMRPGELRQLSRQEIDRLKKNYLIPYMATKQAAAENFHAAEQSPFD